MARPRALFTRSCVVLFVSFHSALLNHAIAQSSCAAPRCLVHLESVPTERVRATLTLDAQTPQLYAREWIVLAPQPVELPGQSHIQSSLTVNGDPVSAPGGWEQSASHRPVLCAHVSVDKETDRHALQVRTVYEATLCARWLVPGPSPCPVASLPPGERRLSTASTQTTDWDSPVFRQWLMRNALRRAPGESDLEFARRAFQTIRSAYSYFYDPDQDRRASAVCRVSQADCGGLSNLLVATLRANGIPARLIIGRWARTAGPKDRCHQLHVKSEFYLQDVGWVPVEMSGAVSDQAAPPARYFGRDTGEFLTLSVNADFLFDPGGWGKRHLLSLQGPCYWGMGEGTFAGCTEQVAWEVVPEARPASRLPGPVLPGVFAPGP